VILAGGLGLRMGGNKPFHPYGASTLIETTLARMLPQAGALYINAGCASAPQAALLKTLALPLLFDDPDWAGLGPLSGVRSAVTLACSLGHSAVITVPCDMPHLPHDLSISLCNAAVGPAQVIHYTGTHDYPLCALWKIEVLSALNSALQLAKLSGGLSVMRFLESLTVHRLRVVNESAFINVNIPKP